LLSREPRANRPQVEKLVVHNRNYVRVHLRNEPNNSPHFTIGSVESFERRVEETQRELGVPRDDWVPVIYHTESGLG
jgi:AFG3 family protein